MKESSEPIDQKRNSSQEGSVEPPLRSEVSSNAQEIETLNNRELLKLSQNTLDDFDKAFFGGDPEKGESAAQEVYVPFFTVSKLRSDQLTDEYDRLLKGSSAEEYRLAYLYQLTSYLRHYTESNSQVEQSDRDKVIMATKAAANFVNRFGSADSEKADSSDKV